MELPSCCAKPINVRNLPEKTVAFYKVTHNNHDGRVKQIGVIRSRDFCTYYNIITNHMAIETTTSGSSNYDWDISKGRTGYMMYLELLSRMYCNTCLTSGQCLRTSKCHMNHIIDGGIGIFIEVNDDAYETDVICFNDECTNPTLCCTWPLYDGILSVPFNEINIGIDEIPPENIGIYMIHPEEDKNMSKYWVSMFGFVNNTDYTELFQYHTDIPISPIAIEHLPGKNDIERKLEFYRLLDETELHVENGILTFQKLIQ